MGAGGDGWKTFTPAYVQKEVDALNAPTSGNVNTLLERILDLPQAVQQCTWQGMPAERVASHLDLFNTIRGEAVHRGTTPGRLNIGGARDWHQWFTRLADRLDSLIDAHRLARHQLALNPVPDA
ncbi:hypothetical protein ACIBUY_03995 [Streptomyces sp. NPDC050085]|uniref:hypothetical protein n=1 Tax=Streptomyces sp. NPDC050085 TaxID=3365600 RepID=UPI0037B5840A